MSDIKITATVTPNADGSVSVTIPKQTYTIAAVKPPMVQITANMPNGQVGVPYVGQLTGSGGKPPYSYAFNPPLPSGMALDAKAGKVGGSPTVKADYTGTAAAVDANNQGATVQVKFSIADAVQPPGDDIGAPPPSVLGFPRDA